MAKLYSRLRLGALGTGLRDVAFASLSLGILAQLGACATHTGASAPLENQTDEVADLSQSDSTSSSSSATTVVEAGSGETYEFQADSASAKRQNLGGPRVAYRGSRAPRIAAAPFQSEGMWMNGFYFVRDGGESWESISQRLYSRNDRSQLLKKWNGGKALEAGTVVYYNSPFRPDDSQSMKVFAEDFGSPLESVTVQSGDWLSKIGQARYGDMRTWMEIVALNPEITNPDLIEVGQVIRVQPVQVDSQAALGRLIEEVAKSQSSAAPMTDPVHETTHEAVAPEHSASTDLPSIPEETVAQAPFEQAEETPMPTQVEQAPTKSPERATKTAQGPPVSELHMQIAALALFSVLLGLVVMRRLRARREQQLAQAAQVTTLPTRSKTGSGA